MDAIDALKTRRSVRSYLDRPVETDIIEDIIDCARLAPTARNVQPWEFVVVTDADTRGQIAGMADYGSFIAQAPVCVAVFCEDGKYFLEDGSAATMAILLAAHAHGLGGCWVAGDKKPYAPLVGGLLGAPADQKLISLISLGYYEPSGSGASKRDLASVLHRERF